MVESSVLSEAAALSPGASDAERRMQTTLMQDAAEFHRVLTELVRVYMFRDRDRSGSHDVGVTGAHALDILVRHGGIGLSQLATELFVDKSTASRIVADLEEKGYVSRAINREDRRAVRLDVTPAGRELHQRIQADNLREAAELLRSFAADVRQGMTARLRQIACTYAVRAGVTDASICLVPGDPRDIPFGADLRIAGPPDLEEALTLLESVGLPTEGIAEDRLGSFVVAREPEHGELIGVAGVESYGAAGVLRTIAVHPSYRGAGLGRTLLLAVANLAKTVGMRELFLVTTTASDALSPLGWEEVPPEDIPDALQKSLELQRAMSAAPVMRLRLS